MSTTNDDKEWDMLTNNIINRNRQKSDYDVDYMVINNTSTHNLEYNSQEANEACSATFSNPDKITITDGITGYVISEISLHNIDNAILHNIWCQQPCSSPFPSNNKDDLVNN